MNVSAFPAIINVNVLSGACPLSCVHCPVGLTPMGERATRFRKRTMDLSVLETIVNEMEHYSDSLLRIHSVGEPLLWADLPKALSICDKRVKTWIFTGLVGCDESILLMLKQKLDIVEVSINSTSRADYLATKGEDRYDEARENLETLSRLPGRARIIVSRVQTCDAAADAEFISYWKNTGLVADAFVRSYHDYNHIIGDEKPVVNRESCLVHFARFNIDTDGMAVVCFNELFREERSREIELGFVTESSISSIWRGEKLTAIREVSLEGDCGRVEGLPCGQCLFCQPLNGNRQTSEHQVASLHKSEAGEADD